MTKVTVESEMRDRFIVPNLTAETVRAYLLARIKVSVTGCWEWARYRDPFGYGRFSIKGYKRLAHRAAFEAFVGPIASGLTIDHLCRNSCCVNPDHLEAVTQRENVLRGVGPTSRNARKTHCPAGHEYDGTRDLGKRGTERTCSRCQARQNLRSYRRRERSELPA